MHHGGWVVRWGSREAGYLYTSWATCNLIQVKRSQQQQHNGVSQLHGPISQLESDDMLPLSPGKTSMCSILCGGEDRAEYERRASPNFGDSLLWTATWQTQTSRERSRYTATYRANTQHTANNELTKTSWDTPRFSPPYIGKFKLFSRTINYVLQRLTGKKTRQKSWVTIRIKNHHHHLRFNGNFQHHWVCKPAYLVAVPSQDKVGGLRQEVHLA